MESKEPKCRYSSWIRVKGLPLHLCNNLVFTEIGVMCDSLMDVDKLIMELKFLSYACLQLVGDKNGFFKEYIDFQNNGRSI